jgi:demethylmenaquinone methyltransferase/2-methoxy-6-polyprenyl-1,4-benzoquinol methylase
MVNEFYDEGAHRAAKVQDLFSRIAPRYDLVNDVQSFGLHRYWKRRLVDLARARAGDRALDVCCGTGDLALRLSRRSARVIGVDFTAEMLAVACDRSRYVLPDAPQFVQADALSLPFHDASFDVVTVAYGLRNLADVKLGLREMKRVARPGARVLVLDFGKPDNALWRGLYFAYLKAFVPVLGRVFCGSSSAYAYILESLKHYPAQNGVAAQMRELGLTNIRIINLLGGVMSINYAETAP